MMQSIKSSYVWEESRDGGQVNEETSTTIVAISTHDEPQSVHDKLYKPHVQSGVFGASANLVNAIVGAGIIGIPYALKQSGIVAGVILLIFVVVLTEKSLRLIVGLASFHPKLAHRNVRTFEDLASYPFGRIGRIFILSNMLILAYGAMLAYLLIIKDTVPPIVRSVFHLSHNNSNEFFQNSVLILSSIVIILPIALKRDMASLSIFSSASVFADLILTIFIIVYAPIKSSVENAGGMGQIISHNVIHPATLFIAVGILSTAMSCQHSCFIISESLENKTQRRWARVTGSSLSVSGFLTATLGIAGYLGFLDQTQGDVLNNFQQDRFEANFARFLLAVTMFFTYPMESFVARHVLVVLFHDGDLDGKDTSTDGIVGDHDESLSQRENKIFLCFNRRHILSLSIFLATLIPAIFLSDIGPVLSITGSLGGSCLCYIAPGLVFLGVYGDEFLTWTDQLLDSYHGRKVLNFTKEKIPKVSQDDLPIEGKSSTLLTTDENIPAMELPIEGDASHILETRPQRHQTKPIWWYLAGFPLWCAIARVGKSNMSANCNRVLPPESSGHEREESKPPTWSDFLYAAVFIKFGMISAIAGLVTNIWFLLH